jgi:dTDP-4-dehydrorhamnose 3,5-epimerase
VFDIAVDHGRDRAAVGLRRAVAGAVHRCIPRFAHGFQTLTDDAELLYHISEGYRPDAARGVCWDDPDLAIAWPKTEQRVISSRDQALPRLRDL